MRIIGDKHGTWSGAGGPAFLVENCVGANRRWELLAGVVAIGPVIGDHAVVIILAVIVAIQEVEHTRRRDWRRRNGTGCRRDWRRYDRGSDGDQRAPDTVRR